MLYTLDLHHRMLCPAQYGTICQPIVKQRGNWLSCILPDELSKLVALDSGGCVAGWGGGWRVSCRGS